MKLIILAISTALFLSLAVTVSAQTSKEEQPSGAAGSPTSAPTAKTKTTKDTDQRNFPSSIKDQPDSVPRGRKYLDDEREEIKKNWQEIRERRARGENPHPTASPGASVSPSASASPSATVSATASTTPTP